MAGKGEPVISLAGLFKRGSEPLMIQNVLCAIRREGSEGHPNRQPFRGLLTWIDVPSDRAVSGARGRRIVITRLAAENAIHTLLGMGIDHHPSSTHHDPRRKVGIITHAEVVEKRIEIAGFIFAKDFPEVVDAVRAGRTSEYGFSYAMSDVVIENTKQRVWTIAKCTFTGAALLLKHKAGYQNTWIELL
jgi:hypothetical protein